MNDPHPHGDPAASAPCHAAHPEPHYADRIDCCDTHLEQVVRIARDTYRIRVAAPRIAARVVPGQFVMIRFANRTSPLIGRALAVWDVIDDESEIPRWIDLVFVRKGAFTTPMSEAAPGTPVTVWGPLGNGFSTTPCDLLVIAAGGVGQTPMLMLAREALGSRAYGSRAEADEAEGIQRPSGWAKAVQIVYGARTADLLAGVADFCAAGLDVRLCTDDGSIGSKHRVPELLFAGLDSQQGHHPNRTVRVVTCGPEVMMQKIAEGCIERSIPCEVSMETPMACGIGICFSCVAMVRETPDGPWDYKRTCVEGPVFEGSRIAW